jgi:hypothetical protein
MPRESALGVLALVGHAVPGKEAFQASGTFTFTIGDSGTLTGQAGSLGSFSGSFSQQGTQHLVGQATFQFADSLLTFLDQLNLNHSTNQYTGTYEILGGTGTLAGTSGFGTAVVAHGSTGVFTPNGSIRP